MSRIRKLFLRGCRTWSVNTKEHIVNKYLETSFSEKCLDLKESPITAEVAKCRRHLAWENKKFVRYFGGEISIKRVLEDLKRGNTALS